ncbi:MAG: hypothetical protein AAB881_00870 [Patescibacteria group bacterium]
MSRIRYLIYAFAGLFFTFGLMIGIQVGTESKPDQKDCVVIGKTCNVENLAPSTKNWSDEKISFVYPSAWTISRNVSASEGAVVSLSNRSGLDLDKRKELIDISMINFRLSGDIESWLTQKNFTYHRVDGTLPTYLVSPNPLVKADSKITTKTYFINNSGSIWEINLISSGSSLIEQFETMFKTIKFGT